MACATCKQKKKINEEFVQRTEFVSKWIGWFLIVWSLLAVYGIYSLITKFL